MPDIQILIEFVLRGLPSTPAGYLLHIAGAMLVTIPVISFTEIVAHGYLMHKRIFPPFLHHLVPQLADVHYRHAIRHHTLFYRQFDYEPDAEGRQENLCLRLPHTTIIAIALFPFFLLLLRFSPVMAITFSLICLLHNKVWNMVHTQMHIPRDVFWRDFAGYRLLARHHFMHHKMPDRNFNIVVPFADFLIGTHAKPGFADIKEMLRLGYLHPRTERGKRLALRLRFRQV